MAMWNVVIVGAKGQIGSAFIELLQHSSLEIEQLNVVGSENDEGALIRFSGKNIPIRKIDEVDWSQYHLAFFVSTQDVTLQHAKIAAQSGCVVIDASGAFVSDYSIPLILPKFNDSMLSEYRSENIISIVNPIISQAIRCVSVLTDIEQLTQLHITNLLPASFYGRKGVNDLAGQSARLLNGLPAEPAFFNQQLAFNILPCEQVSDEKLIEQVRRITHNYQLLISMDTMIVPVFYGLTQSVSFTSAMQKIAEQSDLSLTEYGVDILASKTLSPITITENEEQAFQSIKIANLHYSYGNAEQIQFMSVSDNIRYLGAKILLETAETLLAEYMV